MSEIPHSAPPPGGKPPKPLPIDKSKKAKNVEPLPKDLSGDGQFEYLGFSFTSQKAYETFKYKFLAQMANMMIQQIKRENDQMIKALKKMREDQS